MNQAHDLGVKRACHDDACYKLMCIGLYKFTASMGIAAVPLITFRSADTLGSPDITNHTAILSFFLASKELLLDSVYLLARKVSFCCVTC